MSKKYCSSCFCEWETEWNRREGVRECASCHTDDYWIEPIPLEEAQKRKHALLEKEIASEKAFQVEREQRQKEKEIARKAKEAKPKNWVKDLEEKPEIHELDRVASENYWYKIQRS